MFETLLKKLLSKGAKMAGKNINVNIPFQDSIITIHIESLSIDFDAEKGKGGDPNKGADL